MASINKRSKDHRLYKDARLAGGYGPHAAKQDPEALLRRAVMANLLWENLAYQSGAKVAKEIAKLVPQVDPHRCAAIAVEARTEQKLRHVPLLIAREMARHKTHRFLVGGLLPQIILRADEITEFMAIYWKDGKEPLSKQVRIGLAAAFEKFDEYQLAKYRGGTKEIKLRDVMFLVHPNPGFDRYRAQLYRALANDTLKTPDTWETNLSAGQNQRDVWTRLIRERKLGALAFLRNLRNMIEAGVPESVVREGFDTINPQWLLPLNYFAAATFAPTYRNEIERLMLRGFANFKKLDGPTIFILDTSGSMTDKVSDKSAFNRLDAGAAMAIMAKEVMRDVRIYATAGNDGRRQHATMPINPNLRGFALADALDYGKVSREIGGGGIFTRQCLEWIKGYEDSQGLVFPKRIIVFSDSQDCDYPGRRTPAPFGETNYIIDVSAHTNGINYDGVWTAEISGWSEHFITFIYELEREQEQLGAGVPFSQLELSDYRMP